MAGFFDRVKGTETNFEEAQEGAERFKEQFPHIYAILTGLEGKTEEDSVQPGSIRLFCNGGELKFHVSGRNWKQEAYGLVAKGLEPIVAIEQALQAGQLSWKKITDRKITY